VTTQPKADPDEAEILRALVNLGDAAVAAYRSGEMPREAAVRQALVRRRIADDRNITRVGLFAERMGWMGSEDS